MNAALPTHALPEIVVRAIPPAMLEALKSRFGDRCSTAAAVREHPSILPGRGTDWRGHRCRICVA